MAQTPSPPDAQAALQQPGYFARVTRRDGPAIEQALAGPTLLDEGARLDGAVIEASYAFDSPPLLKRLGEDRITRLVDPQTLRFCGNRYLETESLARLPYAPALPLRADSFDEPTARQLAVGSLSFAQERGADLFIAPGLPLFDRELSRWRDHNERLLAAACAANGGTDVERKPLLAMLAPGAGAQRSPDAIVGTLVDYPIDGVYVQALNLQPVRDSLEKLARFAQFLAALRQQGLPVIVGRVGAFGLVLQALGIHIFDSGLGLAEGHDLAALLRPMTDREHQRRSDGDGGGPPGRVYIEPLKTTLPARVAAELLALDGIRSQFACTLGCCRFRAIEELPARARGHYLHVRRSEVDRMRGLPVAAMRLHEAESRLHSARDLAATVRRALPDYRGLPDFGHLDRWLGLLAREQELALAA